ncbi:MAG: aldose 1-epimerase [Planctomycetaceae bacterium]
MTHDTVTITDPATGSTARVAAHLGFNCFAFTAMIGGEPVEILDAPADFAEGRERPSAYGVPVLFPFPNRIRGGVFTWDGREYKLPESAVPFDGTGNAIHGFALDRAWRIIAAEEDSVIGQFQLSLDAAYRKEYWPADCFIEMRYSLSGTTLRAEVRIANPDERPLPWGFGTHPYFRLPLAKTSAAKACRVEAPADEQWELVGCLPTGVKRPIEPSADLRGGAGFEGLKLDDVLSGLKSAGDVLECVIADEAAGIQVAQRCDAIFRELVAYTPPGRNAVCLEPYTCVTDAIHLEQQGIDAGLRVLPPGEEVRTWIEIAIEPIMA